MFLHSSALGKAMLAMMPEAEIRRILTVRGMTKLTVRTTNTLGRLMTELTGVQAAGYAVDDEEYAPGLRCVAAAVADETGAPLCAVSVSGPTIRVARGRLPALGALVRSVAAELTADMGGQSIPRCGIQPRAFRLACAGLQHTNGFARNGFWR